MASAGSPPSPLRPTVTLDGAGDTSVLSVLERFGPGSARAAAAASAGGGGGGAADGGAALPSIDGLEICCIGAGYVGGPTMAVIAKRAWAGARPPFPPPLAPPAPSHQRPPPFSSRRLPHRQGDRGGHVEGAHRRLEL